MCFVHKSGNDNSRGKVFHRHFQENLAVSPVLEMQEKDSKFGIILDSNQNHRMAKVLLAAGRSTARIISRAPPPDLECLWSFSRGCSCNAAEK
jgi:hypothetical protein